MKKYVQSASKFWKKVDDMIIGVLMKNLIFDDHAINPMKKCVGCVSKL